MEIRLTPFDDKHYVSNVVQSDMTIKWNALGNTHNLIIRSEYGADIQFTEKEKSEIGKFSTEQILSGKEIRYAENCFFSFVPKGYVNSQPIAVSPATYAVFCCEYDESADVCTLFVPNDACLYKCDVSSQIEVKITEEIVKGGGFLFCKKPDKTFYTIHIPAIPGYVDGNLYYTYDGCKYKYPITKTMLGRTFTVPQFNGRKPKIENTSGKGYRITIR